MRRIAPLLVATFLGVVVSIPTLADAQTRLTSRTTTHGNVTITRTTGWSDGQRVNVVDRTTCFGTSAQTRTSGSVGSNRLQLNTSTSRLGSTQRQSTSGRVGTQPTRIQSTTRQIGNRSQTTSRISVNQTTITTNRSQSSFGSNTTISTIRQQSPRTTSVTTSQTRTARISTPASSSIRITTTRISTPSRVSWSSSSASAGHSSSLGTISTFQTIRSNQPTVCWKSTSGSSPSTQRVNVSSSQRNSPSTSLQRTARPRR